MTRNEFLDRLREALGNDLAAPAVQENVDYYNQYILDEVKGGKSEEDVIDGLGDPWVIARTVIDAAEGRQGVGAGSGYAYESDAQYGYERQDGYVKRIETSGRGWWKLIVILLGIIGVLIAVVAVVGGIISLIAPILIPVLILMIIIRSIGRRGR